MLMCCTRRHCWLCECGIPMRLQESEHVPRVVVQGRTESRNEVLRIDRYQDHMDPRLRSRLWCSDLTWSEFGWNANRHVEFELMYHLAAVGI